MKSTQWKQQHAQSYRPFTVGVTGGIGSGKTAVTDFFASKGVGVVDTDVAARVVVEPGTPALAAIEQRYGPDILANGTLDRRKLRTIIFAEANERQWLESLLHPLIQEQIIHELSRVESRYAVLVSPLMLETGQQHLVDRVLVVDVPDRLQIERTMARDQMSEQLARQMLYSQMQREQRVALADDVVDNSGTLAQLHRSLEKLHQRYLNLSRGSVKSP